MVDYQITMYKLEEWKILIMCIIGIGGRILKENLISQETSTEYI